MTSPTAITTDPDWLPHGFDRTGDALTFVNVPRPARDALTFLSDEHYQGRYPKQDLPFSSVQLEDGPGRPLHFIFHSSFCCSTLLARALEVPGIALSLREPDVLIHLANMLVRDEGQRSAQRLDTTLKLLSRTYAPDEIVIAKPSNFANRLLEPVLRRDERTRAILLYSDLPTLLRSIAKKGIWGRVYGRQYYRNILAWTSMRLGFSAAETFEQTDLQIAALAWLMQIHQFNEASRSFGAERVIMLDSARFLEDPAGTLVKAAAFFRIGLKPQAARDIAAGPIFSTHSELGEAPYSTAERASDHGSVDTAHGEEIEVVVKWITAVAGEAAIPLTSNFPS